MAKPKAVKEEPLEKQLWKAADKLRKNIDAAEYKHVVLGLIFLKYISDAFEELYDRLAKGEGDLTDADPEDKDEYQAENVFFVPAEARWTHLVAHAKQPDIGMHVDAAMDAIEKENPSLKGVLPKVYARQNLDPTSLGELIDLIGNIALGNAKARSRDMLGHVFEYFLGEFALAEGKKAGQFYTPRSIVELLVNMLEPYKGRVFDPCCGSGGMFVQSEKFVEEHQGRIDDISIYGQESNQTTWRLAKMNLASRGIDSSQVKWNNEGSFLNDAHKDLKADFIIANPPFNVSDWSGEQLRGDARNLGHLINRRTRELSHDDIQQIASTYHAWRCTDALPPHDSAMELVGARCTRPDGTYPDDAVNEMGMNGMGAADAIRMDAMGAHAIGADAIRPYGDVRGFCASVPISRVAELDYVLTPGRYVGLPDEEDDFNFPERFSALKAEFEAQLQEEAALNQAIVESLARVKV